MLLSPPSRILFLLISLCLLRHAHTNKQVKALDLLRDAQLRRASDVKVKTDLFDLEDLVNLTKLAHRPQDCTREGDEIASLPGQPSVVFSQFGGYVTVDASAGRALYYYFVEASDSKETRPLLLWLNGGPGCSSLGYGAMQELGPFRVYSDGKTLYMNNYSWNHAANLLFLESPAGVGFSYSNRSSDYRKLGDKTTAADNYVFLVNWLERFPEYKGRPLFIAGESYAGHYIPQLASTILLHHSIDKKIVNLKGILIGNPSIDIEMDEMGMYEFFGSHALISPEAASNIKNSCSFVDGEDDPQPEECKNEAVKADRDLRNLNIYNIYASSCSQEGTTATPKDASLMEFDPCTDYYVLAYMNNADVQEAMHVNAATVPGGHWEFCSIVIANWSDSPLSVLDLLQNLLEHDVRVMIFSGDVDGRIPVTSTQYSVKKLKLPVKKEWRPWFHAAEVAGYTVVYEGGLTYATVMGAGHQVPSFMPHRALSMVAHFLAGMPLPRTNYSDFHGK